MLHVRYFCSSNVQNLLRTISSLSSQNSKNFECFKHPPSHHTFNTNEFLNAFKIFETLKAFNSLKKTLFHGINDPDTNNMPHSSSISINHMNSNATNSPGLDKEKTASNCVTSSKKVPILSLSNSTNKKQLAFSVPKFDEFPNTANSIKKKNELRQLGFSGIHSAQNWCAKCNTHFRLTSDLVYHMRTFHKKEEKSSNFVESKMISNLNSKAMALIKDNSQYLHDSEKLHGLSSLKSRIESNNLRCDICNEVFKEKHHMR